MSITQEEKIKQFYDKLSNEKKPTELADQYRNSPKFVGCSQWVYTYLSLFNVSRPLFNNKYKTWSVIINVELIPQLLAEGVDINCITFYSDCEWRTGCAKTLGVTSIIRLPTSNDKQTAKHILAFIKDMKQNKNIKKTNYVLNNLPFSLFKPFKELATELATEKALIIAAAQSFKGGRGFDDVEGYKFLGTPFEAQVATSLIIVNPNGVTELTVYDSKNTPHKVLANPAVAPGDDIDIWQFAQAVVGKSLPGYQSAEKGGLHRKDAIIDPNGIPVIFSAGTVGADFDNKNRAITLNNLNKQTTKFCWATVSASNLPNIGGIGEHKVVVTHAANKVGDLGNPKYAGPNMGCGSNCWYIPCKDKADALDCIRYLSHPSVSKLVRGLKALLLSNSKEVWGQIPHHSQAKYWI